MTHTITTQNASFTLQAGDNLLEALERTGHEVEYQCRQGYCGSCRTRLISGEVGYHELPLAFIAPDEILPCCCTAKTNLTLDVAQTQIDESDQPEIFGESDAQSDTQQACVQGELF